MRAGTVADRVRKKRISLGACVVWRPRFPLTRGTVHHLESKPLYLACGRHPIFDNHIASRHPMHVTPPICSVDVCFVLWVRPLATFYFGSLRTAHPRRAMTLMCGMTRITGFAHGLHHVYRERAHATEFRSRQRSHEAKMRRNVNQHTWQQARGCDDRRPPIRILFTMFFPRGCCCCCCNTSCTIVTAPAVRQRHGA